MRIIRGKYKTRKYKFPKGFPSRPTTDFAKEGLFNILEHNYKNSNLNPKFTKADFQTKLKVMICTIFQTLLFDFIVENIL